MDAPGFPVPSFKYRAFISYSHRDERWADWLHKAIEHYRVPKPLIGQPGPHGPIPKQLFPVFRDREELASSANLSNSLREALAQSALLIVVCSSQAAQSRWVNEEILAFKRLGRADRILALIVEGEPHAVMPDQECFPPALRFKTDAAGNLTEDLAEPIAADLRPQGDGKDAAKLKLIAGLLGVSFNDLKHRELIAARRRARIYQSIAAAMLLLAILAVGGGWMAWQYAKQSEARLEQAIDIATGLVNETVKLSDRSGIPLEVVGGLLDRADVAFENLFRTGANSRRLRAQKAVLLMVFADAYSVMGSVERQWETAIRARTILAALAEEESSNSEWQRLLAMSHNIVGEALVVRGQPSEALEAYRTSLAIRQKLAEADPEDGQRQQDLSLSLNRLGDILRTQEQWDEVLDAYRGALAISERLAAADPENAEAQRDLSQSQSRVGDILARNDLSGAEEAYQASLAIAEHLAAANPEDSQLQLDLAAAHEKLGTVVEKQGRLEEALASYQATLKIAERLAAADPKNAEAQRNLSLACDRIGTVLAKKEDLAAALTAHRQSLKIAERLAQQDPSNAQWQRELSITYNKVGDILFRQKELDEALDLYRKSLLIRERLAVDTPSSDEAQRDLSLVHNKIGRVLKRKGKFDASLAEYRLSLAIAEQLVAADPLNLKLQRELGVGHNSIGDVLTKKGEFELALAAYRSALLIRERIAAANRSNMQWRKDLLESYVNVISIEEQRGNIAGAQELDCRARDVLAEFRPSDATRAVWLDRLAALETRLSRHGKATLPCQTDPG